MSYPLPQSLHKLDKVYPGKGSLSFHHSLTHISFVISYESFESRIEGLHWEHINVNLRSATRLTHMILQGYSSHKNKNPEF